MDDLGSRGSDNKDTFKLGAHGEPYRFQAPKPDGNPWQTLLTPMMEQDKKQCDAWKDEVQNLLIFAGLFSAVTTAFSVETYKGLQPDPNANITLLLSRIASSLESTDLHSTLTPAAPFSPTPSIVRVNICLFVSLILSLTTVLVGIISLQWLRGAPYTSGLSPQNTFAAMNMRSDALKQWHVPEIFSTLPLLLQLALVLFFIGIIEFLKDINVTVAIPVSLCIALTLSFLVITTTWPTFQAFVLRYPFLKITDEVPTPCPYSSPQSKAFRRLITSSRLVFSAISLPIAALYWVVMRLYLLIAYLITSCSRPLRAAGESISGVIGRTLKPLVFDIHTSLDLSSRFGDRIRQFLRLDGNPKPWKGFQYMAGDIFDIWREHSAIDFDTMWLSVRDNYHKSVCQPGSWLYERRCILKNTGGNYDSTEGLLKELDKEDVNTDANYETPLWMAYHCQMQSLESTPKESNEDYMEICNRNQMIASLLGYEDNSTPSSMLVKNFDEGDLALLTEERAFIMLHEMQYRLLEMNKTSATLLLTKHYAEVLFRFVGLLYSQFRPMVTTSNPPQSSNLIIRSRELYILEIFDSPNQPFTTQWAATIRLYFDTWGSAAAEDVDFEHSFHIHPFFRDYVWHFWKQIRNEVENTRLQKDTLDEITRTCNTIRDQLTRLCHPNSQQAFDCLFYASAVYIQNYRHLLPTGETYIDEAIADLVLLVKDCRKEVEKRSSRFEVLFGSGVYDENQRIVLLSEAWWDVLVSSK